MLKNGNLSIGEILDEICSCSRGRPIQWWGEPNAIGAIAREFSIEGSILHIAASPVSHD